MKRGKSKPIKSIITKYLAEQTPFRHINNYGDNLNRLAYSIGEISNKLWTLEPENYYCYIYLDPGYPGSYEYLCPSGKILRFNHRPIYVGKGQGSRKFAHVVEANSGAKGNHKLRILRKLKRKNIAPIIKCTSYVTEFLAFAAEIDFIAGIGRYNLHTGPLVNLTDGGEGASGAIRSEEEKLNLSKHMTGRVAHNKGIACSAEQKLKISITLSGRVPSIEERIKNGDMQRGKPKHSSKSRLKISEQNKKYWSTHPESLKARGLKCSLSRAVQPDRICPKCGTIGRGPAMTRWHFANCTVGYLL